MIVSSAQNTDLDAVLALEEIGFPEQERWGAQAWQAEFDAADGHVLVGRAMAHGGVIAVAAYRYVDEFGELFRIIVDPEHQGRGLGRQLTKAGEQWARALGAKRMLLEVRDDNESAIAMYTRLGFAPLTIRADYYGPGTKAIVMEREFTDLKSASHLTWEGTNA